MRLLVSYMPLALEGQLAVSKDSTAPYCKNNSRKQPPDTH